MVGINSQIYSETGGYQGVSFAIPIDVALHVRDQIVKTGKAVRARLGVTSGMVVEQVAGAAARAGIETGDVILAVNGTPVRSVKQLQAPVSKESKHLPLLIQRGDAQIFIPSRWVEDCAIRSVMGAWRGNYIFRAWFSESRTVPEQK